MEKHRDMEGKAKAKDTRASPKSGNSSSEEVRGHWTTGSKSMEQWMDGNKLTSLWGWIPAFEA